MAKRSKAVLPVSLPAASIPLEALVARAERVLLALSPLLPSLIQLRQPVASIIAGYNRPRKEKPPEFDNCTVTVTITVNRSVTQFSDDIRNCILITSDIQITITDGCAPEETRTKTVPIMFDSKPICMKKPVPLPQEGDQPPKQEPPIFPDPPLNLPSRTKITDPNTKTVQETLNYPDGTNVTVTSDGMSVKVNIKAPEAPDGMPVSITAPF